MLLIVSRGDEWWSGLLQFWNAPGKPQVSWKWEDCGDRATLKSIASSGTKADAGKDSNFFINSRMNDNFASGLHRLAPRKIYETQKKNKNQNKTKTNQNNTLVTVKFCFQNLTIKFFFKPLIYFKLSFACINLWNMLNERSRSFLKILEFRTSSFEPQEHLTAKLLIFIHIVQVRYSVTSEMLASQVGLRIGFITLFSCKIE